MSKSNRSILFFTILACFLLLPTQARMQSAIVSGRLVCCAGIIINPIGNLNEGETPADTCPNFFCPGVEGALVQIIERDTVDPDDLLANFRSLPNGFFSGIGQEDEMFDVDVDLVVTHQCGAKPKIKGKAKVEVAKDLAEDIKRSIIWDQARIIKEMGCTRKTTVKVPTQMINSCAAFTIDPFDLFHPAYETIEECG